MKMACDRNQNLFIRAACRLGVSRIAGKSAYLAVAGLAAGALGAIAVGRKSDWFVEANNQQRGPVDVSDLPTAAFGAVIESSTPSAGGQCTACESGTAKPGPWYAIDGKEYCSDCAPDAAREAGVRLSVPVAQPAVPSGPSFSPLAREEEKRPAFGPEARPTPSTTDGAPIYPTRRVVVESGSSPVTLERVDGSTHTLTLKGVKVFKREDGSGVGLGITPVIAEIEGEGARVVPKSWQITHTDTGRRVADLIFDSPEEALPLGTLLAQFNWRGETGTIRREVATIKATIGAYKKAVEDTKQAFTEEKTRKE